METIDFLVAEAYGKYVERIGRKPRPMLTDYHAAVVTHQVWLCEQGDVAVSVLGYRETHREPLGGTQVVHMVTAV